MLRQSLFSDRGAQVLAGLTEVRRHGCDRLLRITAAMASRIPRWAVMVACWPRTH
ncbi:hypothetical protein [Streptomyces sp. NPDC005525]|uniref:hypothetical protein n=1 Tax=Streptomyces sp. NPDC005525 TaxID=3364720 RepID=UPI0036BE2962